MASFFIKFKKNQKKELRKIKSIKFIRSSPIRIRILFIKPYFCQSRGHNMKTFYIKLVCLSFLLLLGSCASSLDVSELSKKEKKYFSKIKKMKPKFKMSKFKSDKAMRRGAKFIQKYGLMALDESNEEVIRSKSAKAASDGTIGYKVVKEEKGNTSTFTVSCEHGVGNYKFNDDVCKMNEKILAYYIKTGVIQTKFINKAYPN